MRAWRLPPDVSSDDLAPAHAFAGGFDVVARACLEQLRPGFANQVRRGDVIVAGANFGIGPSREQAAAVLVRLGIAAVVAPCFGGAYFRNAFNLGLLLLTCPRALVIDDGEAIAFDARAGCIARGNGELLETESIPAFLLDRVEAGGLLEQLRARALQRSRPA